jgi:hypothetical protein
MRDNIAAVLSSEHDTDNDVNRESQENNRLRRRRPLAKLDRENHELYDKFIK